MPALAASTIPEAYRKDWQKIENELAAVEGTADIEERPKRIKKKKYFAHIESAFDEYKKAFIVNADNVGSKQMQEIRIANRDNWYV